MSMYEAEAALPKVDHTRSRRRVALVGGALLLAAIAIAYLGISAYVADKLSRPNRLALTSTPSDYGLAYERVHFASVVDNLPLEGWYMNSAGGKTILILHGLGSTRDGHPSMEVAQALTRSGYNLLMFDFRGHGESGGTRFAFGMLEVRDVAGALAYLKTRGVTEVGVIGYSLGAVTALHSAPDQPALRAIVADSPFADLQPLLDAELPAASGLPPAFTPGIELLARVLYGIDLANNKPVNSMARLGDRPLLLIHGTADGQVPLSQAYDLQKAGANNVNLQLWVVPNADHVRAFDQNPAEYMRRVISFFDQFLR